MGRTMRLLTLGFFLLLAGAAPAGAQTQQDYRMAAYEAFFEAGQRVGSLPDGEQCFYLLESAQNLYRLRKNAVGAGQALVDTIKFTRLSMEEQGNPHCGLVGLIAHYNDVLKGGDAPLLFDPAVIYAVNQPAYLAASASDPIRNDYMLGAVVSSINFGMPYKYDEQILCTLRDVNHPQASILINAWPGGQLDCATVRQRLSNELGVENSEGTKLQKKPNDQRSTAPAKAAPKPSAGTTGTISPIGRVESPDPGLTDCRNFATEYRDASGKVVREVSTMCRNSSGEFVEVGGAN